MLRETCLSSELELPFNIKERCKMHMKILQVKLDMSVKNIQTNNKTLVQITRPRTGTVENKNLTIPHWLSQSPHLNPIRNMWCCLKLANIQLNLKSLNKISQKMGKNHLCSVESW